MKVYKNPFVPRESYFVKTGVGHSYIESPKSKGYIVELVGGKWEVREGCYYDFSLKNELPLIAENKVSINTVDGVWKVKDIFSPCRVTHRMPMPKPPKGE